MGDHFREGELLEAEERTGVSEKNLKKAGQRRCLAQGAAL